MLDSLFPNNHSSASEGLSSSISLLLFFLRLVLPADEIRWYSVLLLFISTSETLTLYFRSCRSKTVYVYKCKCLNIIQLDVLYIGEYPNYPNKKKTVNVVFNVSKSFSKSLSLFFVTKKRFIQREQTIWQSKLRLFIKNSASRTELSPNWRESRL